MLVIAGALIGAVIGALTAKRHGGKPADMAQYAAGYGIALALLGLIVTIVIDRTLV
jgi:F0F1-type ATP synthase assembly protein I